jgi:hypothetical protein
MTTSSDVVARAGRAAHDLGLAGLLGGTLFGRLALHPAVANISDPRERGEVVNAAWRRYGVVNALGLSAVAAGRAVEPGHGRRGAAEQRLGMVRDGLLGALVASGLASAVEGVRFGRSAPHGAVPLEDGSRAAPDASARAAALKRRLNALGAVTMAAEVGLVVVDGALADVRARRRRVRGLPLR